MNYKNKLIFYIAIFIYLLVFFRNTWLPGASILLNKEYFIIDGATIFLVLMIFDFTFFFKISKDKFRFENYLILILALILIISILIYNIKEILNLNSLIILLAFFSTIFIYFVQLPKYLLSNLKDFYKIFFISSNFGLIIAIIGLFFFIFHITGDIQYQFALTSVIVHPNFVSPIFILGIFSSLFVYEIMKKQMRHFMKIFLFISMFVQILSLFLTLSRNGIIALLIGMLTYLILRYRIKCLFFLPLFILIAPLLKNVFMTKGLNSFIGRLYLLVPAYIMLKESTIKLLWGYGLYGSFKEYQKYMVFYNPLDESSMTKNVINNPHNSFVSIVLMFGLIFFIVLIILIIVIALRFFNNYISNKEIDNKNLYISIFSITVALLALGLFEGQLVQTIHFNLQPFLLFLGIMFYMNKIKLNLLL